MPLISTHGVSLNAVEIGEGPPVVMLHGLMVGSSASWYFTSAPAIARDFKVLLFDLRGHGRSGRVLDGYDTLTMMGDLEGLLDAWGWKGPVSLVGHSWGAMIAMRFAAAHPERVAKLALVEPPLPPSKLPDLQNFLDLGPAGMAEALPSVLGHILDRRGRQADKLLASLGFLAFETTMLQDVEREKDFSKAELAALKKPLLVFGDRSPCRDVGDRLLRQIPGARLTMLAGGHYLHLEATEALTRVLREHLSS